jgi:hypothetical protein
LINSDRKYLQNYLLNYFATKNSRKGWDKKLEKYFIFLKFLLKQRICYVKIMKIFYITVVVVMLLINLVCSLSALADKESQFSKHSDYLVGQKVVWLYKPRADSDKVQRIPAEVVKLGPKQVQVRVRKHNNKFIDRWVNPDRLENH